MARSSLPALLALLGAAWAAAAAPPLTVSDPWVREPPPGTPVTAAYLTLHNPSGAVQAVSAVTSSAFGRVEMHRTEMLEGAARMVPQERLEVPPGGQLSLAPGGYHLMLFEPRRPLREGDRVDLRLEVSGGEAVDVEAPVRKEGAEAGHHHHGDHHAH